MCGCKLIHESVRNCDGGIVHNSELDLQNFDIPVQMRIKW